MAKVFIAYAEGDESWVRGFLIPALGLPADEVLLPEHFTLGKPITENFAQAVCTSSAVLVVFSDSFQFDQWTRYAAQLATHTNVTTDRAFVPIVRGAYQLERGVGIFEAAKFADPPSTNQWEAEAKRIRDHLQLVLPDKDTEQCPFPGHEAYTGRDSVPLRGRENELELTLRRLETHTRLFVVGASGSGKTSFIFAGVLPALQGTNRFYRAGYWLVRVVDLGDEPMAAIAKALDGNPWEEKSWNAFKNTSAQRIVLVIDALQTVRSLSSKNRKAFWKWINALSSPQCAVFASIRSDQLASMLNDGLTILPGEKIDMHPLDGQGLRHFLAAQKEPEGVFFDPVLVERIGSEFDANHAAGMMRPLQLTLRILWARRIRKHIPAECYTSNGQTAVEQALGDQADAIMQQLERRGPMYPPIAVRILLRLVDGDKSHFTWKWQPTIALRSLGDEHVFSEVLEALSNQGLIVIDKTDEPPGTRVALAHPAILKGWTGFNGLLDRLWPVEKKRRLLEQRVQAWLRTGKTGYLLDGLELADVAVWLGTAEAGEVGHDENANALIATSRNAFEKSQRFRKLATWAAASAFAVIAGLSCYAWHEASLMSAMLEHEKERGRKSHDAALVALAHEQLAQGLAPLAATTLRDVDDPTDTKGWTSAALEALSEPFPQVTIEAHEMPLVALDLSPDGGRILTAAKNDSEARVWATETGQLIWSRKHDSPVTHAMFSHNGQYILTATESGQINLHDLSQNRSELKVSVGGAYIQKAVLDGSDSHILTVSADNIARIYSIAHMLEHQAIPDAVINGCRVINADVSQDARYVATGCDDGIARVWQLDKSRPLQLAALDHQQGQANANKEVTEVIFSEDGTRLGTVWRGDNDAHVWDWRRRTSRQFSGHSMKIWSLAFDPTGTRIVTASDDGKAIVTPLDGARPRITLYHGLPIRNAIFRRDGAYVMTSARHSGGSVKLWRADEGGVPIEYRLKLGSAEGYPRVAMNMPSQRLVTTVGDGNAEVWNFSQPPLPRILKHGADRFAVNARGGQIITRGDVGVAQVWSLDGELQSHGPEHSQVINDLAVSADGTKIITVADDLTAKVWGQTGESLGVLSNQTRRFTLVDTNSDASVVVMVSPTITTSYKGDALPPFFEVRAWTRAPNQTSSAAFVEKTLGIPPDTRNIRSVRLDPSGERAVVATGNHGALIVPVRNSGAHIELAHMQPVQFATFTRCSGDEYVLTLPENESARLYRSDSKGAHIELTRGVGPAVRAAAIGDNGCQILLAYVDCSAKIWDIPRRQAIIEIPGRKRDPRCQNGTIQPRSAAFVKQRAIIGFSDGQAQIWETDPERLMTILREQIAVCPHNKAPNALVFDEPPAASVDADQIPMQRLHRKVRTSWCETSPHIR